MSKCIKRNEIKLECSQLSISLQDFDRAEFERKTGLLSRALDNSLILVAILRTRFPRN